MTRDEIQQALNMSSKKNVLSRHIKPSLESGLIEMTISDKPQSSKQQYRLTELGLSVAQELK